MLGKSEQRLVSGLLLTKVLTCHRRPRVANPQHEVCRYLPDLSRHATHLVVAPSAVQHPSDKLLTAAAQTAWRVEIVHSQWLKSCYAHKQLVPTSEFRIDAAAVLASQDKSQADQSAPAQRAPLRTLPGNFATGDAPSASVAYSQGAGAAADTLVKLSRDAAAPAAGTAGDLQRSRDGSGSESDGSPHILIPDTEPHAGDACENSPLTSTSGRSRSRSAPRAAVQACARAGTSARLAAIQEEEEDAEAADCAAAAIPVLGVSRHRKKRRSTVVRKTVQAQ